MHKPAIWRFVLTGSAVVLFSGCFAYRPAEIGTLPEGGQIRLQLTRQGYADLPDIPIQTGARLSGTLVSRDNDQLRMRVPLAVDALNRTLGQEYVIPASNVIRFERREFSRTRTGIAVAAGLVSAVTLYLGFEKGNPFNREDPEAPETEEGFTKRNARFLILRIPSR